MLAYHSKPELRQFYIDRAVAHRKADEIVQNYGYWKDGKGCAVGCLAHADKDAHQVLENDAGLPIALNRLADTIFEGLPKKDAVKWPEQYVSAAKEGADLSLVHWKFLYWVLTEELKVTGEGEIFDDVRKAIAQCADVLIPLTKGEKVDKKAARSAASAAWSAESAARSARSAASAAWSAGSAARFAAWSAAWSAESAARSARSAASAAWFAASAAWFAAYKRMAIKLLELMSEAA